MLHIKNWSVYVYTNELSGTEVELYHHFSNRLCIDIYADYIVYKFKKKADVPDVARGILKTLFKKISNFEKKNVYPLFPPGPRVSMGSLKKISQFYPAVWPAITNF